MADAGDDDLAASRALAPTLAATAAVLPWLARPAAPRFPAQLNQRWREAGRQLHAQWAARHAGGDIRPALFALYAAAVDSGDTECLQLAEALAEAGDHLDAPPSPRLSAALSATAEFLADPAGLEQNNFAERARHFAQRLRDAGRQPGSRSPLLDQLFVDEALERVERMRDGLAVLPADAYALTNEASGLAEQAAELELWGVMHLARDFARRILRDGLDDDATLAAASAGLDDLARCIAAISG